MPDETYDLIAMGARYWFVLLGVVIVWRSYIWLLNDSRTRKRQLHNLPDAGMVGEVVNLESGDTYPLPREGVIGGGRSCDICLPGLRRRHITFTFVSGRGVLLSPCHHDNTSMDGIPIRRGGYATHGARIEAGDYSLRMRLFAGLDVPRSASVAAYTAETQPLWQPAYDNDLWAPDSVNEKNRLPDLVFSAETVSQDYDPQLTWQYAPYPVEMVRGMPEDIPGEISLDNRNSAEDNPFPVSEKTIRHHRSGRRRING